MKLDRVDISSHVRISSLEDEFEERDVFLGLFRLRRRSWSDPRRGQCVHIVIDCASDAVSSGGLRRTGTTGSRPVYAVGYAGNLAPSRLGEAPVGKVECDIVAHTAAPRD